MRIQNFVNLPYLETGDAMKKWREIQKNAQDALVGSLIA